MRWDLGGWGGWRRPAYRTQLQCWRSRLLHPGTCLFEDVNVNHVIHEHVVWRLDRLACCVKDASVDRIAGGRDKLCLFAVQAALGLDITPYGIGSQIKRNEYE